MYYVGTCGRADCRARPSIIPCWKKKLFVQRAVRAWLLLFFFSTPSSVILHSVEKYPDPIGSLRIASRRYLIPLVYFSRVSNDRFYIAEPRGHYCVRGKIPRTLLWSMKDPYRAFPWRKQMAKLVEWDLAWNVFRGKSLDDVLLFVRVIFQG